MNKVSYLCSVTDEVTKHRQLDAQTSRSMLVPYTEHLGFLLIHMDEIWKPVLGYEGLYEVSNLGRVKSLDRVVARRNGRSITIHGKIMVPFLFVAGRYFKRTYRRFNLSKNGKNHPRYAHVLVAQAFIPNPENKPFVDHINGTEHGDGVDNLRWCTRLENQNFAMARKHNSEAKKGKRNPNYGRSGSKHPMFGRSGALNPTSKPVEQYTLDGRFVQLFEGTADVERKTGILQSSIAQACRGEIKTSHGYIWKYKEQ